MHARTVAAAPWQLDDWHENNDRAPKCERARARKIDRGSIETENAFEISGSSRITSKSDLNACNSPSARAREVLITRPGRKSLWPVCRRGVYIYVPGIVRDLSSLSQFIKPRHYYYLLIARLSRGQPRAGNETGGKTSDNCDSRAWAKKTCLIKRRRRCGGVDVLEDNIFDEEGFIHYWIEGANYLNI